MTDPSIRIFSSFEEAESAWRELEDSPATYLFQRFDWLKNWFDSVGYRRFKPCILLVEPADGDWRLLAPLGICRTGPFRVLTWLGGKVTDYQGPVVAGANQAELAANLPALWKAARKRLPAFDVAHFVHQPALLADGSENPWLRLSAFPSGGSYQAVLEGSWNDYIERQVKPRIRADSVRQRRRLAEAGEVRFVLATDAAEIKTLTDTMIAHKRRRYAEMDVADLFDDAAYRKFYHAAGAALHKANLLHLSALYCGDTVVATHWGAVCHDRFYFLMPTFEGDEWRRYSAGRLLQEDVMKWAFERGLRLFDLTTGDEPYKREWSNSVMTVYERVEGRSLVGLVYLLAHRLRRALRTVPQIRALVLRVRSAKKSKSL